MFTHGANVEELRRIASGFSREAETLRQMHIRIADMIRTLQWSGADQVGFTGTWESTHARRVHVCADALAGMADRLRAECDEQERASGGTGAGVPGGASLSPWDGPSATWRRRRSA